MARLVARWVRFYTRGLPTPIAERRIDEIDADVHDHIAHERAEGTGDGRIALGIVSRMVRGLGADASWRRLRVTSRFTSRLTLATALILLIPLVAMQFTDEVAWTAADFAVAAVLLFGAGRAYQLMARRGGNAAYRLAVGVAVGAGLMLVWLVGAVGVIGEEGDRADLMYAGVLAVGIVGAAIARFQPAGMTRALLAMALAQGLVTVIALIAGKHQAAISSLPELLGLNGFFIALYLGSAWLFRQAAAAPRGSVTS
jgi:hypothetical protein